jgi:hypothetical protein
MRSFANHKGKYAIGAIALIVGLVSMTDILGVPQPVETGPREAAQLLPASTLLYVEFSQPRPIVQELAAMLQGSTLEDLPGFISDFREKQGDDLSHSFRETLSILGAFLGPEGLSEAGRLKAGCFAITGFDKRHEPEFLWVLLAGESNIPGVYMRGLLSSSDNYRTVERVEGVRLYRELDWRRGGMKKAFIKDKGIEEPDDLPESRFSGPTMALLPGALIVGSNQATVRDAVRRARGKSAEQALSASTPFRKTQELRNRPGLFFYADSAALRGEVDKMIQSRLHPESFAAAWRTIETACNLKSVDYLAGSLTLQRGGLDLQMQLRHDPDQEVPILSLLPDKAVDPELLKLAPRDAQVSVAMSWPDGEKRWDRMVALGDKLYAGLASKLVANVEEKFKHKFGKDVSARIAGATWSLGSDALAKNYPVSQQVLAIRATDEKAAEGLEAALVDGVRLAADDATIKPVAVEGVAGVQSLAVGPQDPLFFTRDGAVLMIGLDARHLGAAAAGARRKGMLGTPGVADAVKTLEEPIVLGVASPTQIILSAMRNELARTKQAAGEDVRAKANVTAMEKVVEKLKETVEAAPPAVISLSRKPGVTTLQARQLGLRAVSVQTVDSLVEWQLRQQIAERTIRNRFGVKDKKGFAPAKEKAADVFKDKDKTKEPAREEKDKDKKDK